MNKGCFFLVTLIALIFSISFINANFVCGFVNDSQNFSSSWSNILIYPAENNSAFSSCEVSPENKFCCDLDEIPSFNYSIGRQIVAEVFDEQGGFVGGPVILSLTGEGYDVFPDMYLQKAIIINSPSDNIFTNISSIWINISLASGYNNLNYTLNSSSGFSQEHLCTNCTDPYFLIPLDKGRNELNVIAYNDYRQMSYKKIFYNLDYLNMSLNVFCDKCKVKNKGFYIPSNENITFSSSFEASHNISGDFLFYFPSDWELLNISDTSDFSGTHSVITEHVEDQKDFSVNYTLQSPKTFIKKEYSFSQEFGNENLTSTAILFKWGIIPFKKLKQFDKHYFYFSKIQMGSEIHPIILQSKADYIQLAAIYPKINIENTRSSIKFTEKKHGKNKGEYFTILTSISQKYIKNIFLVFKVEKGRQIQVYDDKTRLNLNFYKNDSSYTYYSAYINKKGPFRVRIF